MHPFAGAPWDKIEIATHQMTDTPVNGLPGHAWVEAQDKEAVGSMTVVLGLWNLAGRLGVGVGISILQAR